MVLFDINIYLYCHREDSPHHSPIKQYVEHILSGIQPFGYSPLALSGFLRIITHPKIFTPPTASNVALEFINEIITLPHAIKITPGDMHWEIFTTLCVESRATGNLIPDAYFAALAMEAGCTWITTDRDYSKFPGLDWQDPLA
ncbi:MAG: type II toxin-antitoxin system VapC family toxin [Spirochaetales bacterium]|nr:type II toxin-antitoxin system VapC family toxin [Spirochaetales bacterium]